MKTHIVDGEARKCTAQTPETCTARNSDGTKVDKEKDHFNTKAEADVVVAQRAAKEAGNTFKKITKKGSSINKKKDNNEITFEDGQAFELERTFDGGHLSYSLTKKDGNTVTFIKNIYNDEKKLHSFDNKPAVSLINVYEKENAEDDSLRIEKYYQNGVLDNNEETSRAIAITRLESDTMESISISVDKGIIQNTAGHYAYRNVSHLKNGTSYNYGSFENNVRTSTISSDGKKKYGFKMSDPTNNTLTVADFNDGKLGSTDENKPAMVFTDKNSLINNKTKLYIKDGKVTQVKGKNWDRIIEGLENIDKQNEEIKESDVNFNEKNESMKAYISQIYTLAETTNQIIII